MLCYASLSFAQVAPKFVYAEIVGESRLFSTKVTVSIDYGQSTSFFENTKVKNEDGSNRKFNSMVDAMNYMGSSSMGIPTGVCCDQQSAECLSLADAQKLHRSSRRYPGRNEKEFPD